MSTFLRRFLARMQPYDSFCQTEAYKQLHSSGWYYGLMPKEKVLLELYIAERYVKKTLSEDELIGVVTDGRDEVRSTLAGLLSVRLIKKDGNRYGLMDDGIQRIEDIISQTRAKKFIEALESRM